MTGAFSSHIREHTFYFSINNRQLTALFWLFLLAAWCFSPRLAFGEISGATSQATAMCDVQITSSLSLNEADAVYRATLLCLESQLGGQKVDESSKAYQLLEKILNSNADAEIKLTALTTYSNRAYRTESKAFLDLLSQKLNFVFDMNLGRCTADYQLCDQMIHNALGTAHIFPALIAKVADSLAKILMNLNYGVIIESLRLRTKAMKTLAIFYSSVALSFSGNLPRWKVERAQQEIITSEINKLSGDLIGFSQVFSADEIQEFIPNEYLEFYKTSLSPQESAVLSRKLIEPLHQLGNLLASIAIYSQRLGKSDISSWLNEHINKSKSDENHYVRFLNTLILFGEYEARLPQREAYINALRFFSNREPVIANFAEFLSSISSQIDNINAHFAKNSNLEKTFEYEVDSANIYPDFSSFLFQSQVLTTYASLIPASAQAYKFDPSKENQLKYENTVGQYERRWFALTCAGLIVAKQKGKLKHPMLGTIKLPLSGEEISRERCLNGTTLAAIDQEYDQNFNFIRGIRPLKNAIIFTSAAAITIVSAGLATAGEAAAGFVVRTASIAARNRIFSTFNAVRAVSNAAIFTTSMKVLSAAAGIAPIWRKGEGIYGNILKPWFSASVIFFFMPATAIVSTFLSDAMLSAGVAQNLRAFTTSGIDLMVNTVAFSGSEYTHRTLETLMQQRKVVFSGDMPKVGTESFIYALAFRIAFSRLRVPAPDLSKIGNLKNK
jgi:hypothetical protein